MSAEGIPRVPPYVIRTERLTIRCWEPRDAALLKDALDTSLEHLRPWMPWALDEPKPLEEKIDLLRRFRGLFDLGQDFVYGVFDRDEGEVVGGSGLHTRVGDDALEIGYWLRASAVGRGLARETTAALTVVEPTSTPTSFTRPAAPSSAPRGGPAWRRCRTWCCRA